MEANASSFAGDLCTVLPPNAQGPFIRCPHRAIFALLAAGIVSEKE
jgi:hypothetical protein